MSTAAHFRSWIVFAIALTAAPAQQVSYHFEGKNGWPFGVPGVYQTQFMGPTTFFTECGVAKLRPFDSNSHYVYGIGMGGTGQNSGPEFVIEARLRVVGATPNSGAPNDTAIIAAWPSNSPTTFARCGLQVNAATRDVGLFGYPLPTNGAAEDGVWHKYRIVISGFSSSGPREATLFIDDVPEIGPVVLPGAPMGSNALNAGLWAFGQIVFDQPTGGDDIVDWDYDYITITNSMSGQGQPNSHNAALFVGRDAATEPGMIGHRGPFALTVAPGTPAKLEWNGPPLQAFALLASVANPAGTDFGCVGLADIGTPPIYNDLSVVFDPFGFGGLFFHTDACGYATQTLVVPASIPPGTILGSFQGLVFQPSGCPFVLTASYTLTT